MSDKKEPKSYRFEKPLGHPNLLEDRSHTNKRRKQRYDHGGDKGIATPIGHSTHTHCESRGVELPTLWQANEPATIEELIEQIPNDPSAEVDATCPFHGCLLEHRTSNNSFNYVECPAE